MSLFQTLGRVMGPASRLRLECEACGHVALWRGTAAVRRLGPDATPFEVRRKLRCGACGAAGQVRLRV